MDAQDAQYLRILRTRAGGDGSGLGHATTYHGFLRRRCRRSPPPPPAPGLGASPPSQARSAGSVVPARVIPPEPCAGPGGFDASSWAGAASTIAGSSNVLPAGNHVPARPISMEPKGDVSPAGNHVPDRTILRTIPGGRSERRGWEVQRPGGPATMSRPGRSCQFFPGGRGTVTGRCVVAPAGSNVPGRAGGRRSAGWLAGRHGPLRTGTLRAAGRARVSRSSGSVSRTTAPGRCGVLTQDSERSARAAGPRADGRQDFRAGTQKVRRIENV